MSEDEVEVLGPLVRWSTENVLVNEGVIGEGGVASEEEVASPRW